MCGYCTERIALEKLSKDVHGRLPMKNIASSMDRYFYLRETHDFLSALDRVQRSLVQRKMLSTELPVLADVILFRGLVVLMEEGFNSLTYQRLLRKPMYRDAVIIACSTQKRTEYEVLSQGLDVWYLGMLYDAETYFWEARSNQLRNLAQLLPACRTLLKHYISWWLNGDAVNQSQLLAKITELKLQHLVSDVSYDEQSETAVYDRACDVRFESLSRAFYFSIMVVGSCSAGKKMMLGIAQNSPALSPSFIGNDLWFQRVAALKLFETIGFETFSKYSSDLRATLYLYVNLMHTFTPEQKYDLLMKANNDSRAENTDDYVNLVEWLAGELGF